MQKKSIILFIFLSIMGTESLGMINKGVLDIIKKKCLRKHKLLERPDASRQIMDYNKELAELNKKIVQKKTEYQQLTYGNIKDNRLDFVKREVNRLIIDKNRLPWNKSSWKILESTYDLQVSNESWLQLKNTLKAFQRYEIPRGGIIPIVNGALAISARCSFVDPMSNKDSKIYINKVVYKADDSVSGKVDNKDQMNYLMQLIACFGKRAITVSTPFDNINQLLFLKSGLLVQGIVYNPHADETAIYCHSVVTLPVNDISELEFEHAENEYTLEPCFKSDSRQDDEGCDYDNDECEEECQDEEQ